VREVRDAAPVEGCELVCVLGAGRRVCREGATWFGNVPVWENFGFMKGVIQTLGIRLVLVRPQLWQKGFGLGTASELRVENHLEEQASRGRDSAAGFLISA